MKRPRQTEPDEVMRAGHDLVVKVRVQEAFEADDTIGAATLGES